MNNYIPDKIVKAYFILADGQLFVSSNQYFDCLGSVTSLLEDNNFKRWVPGFYINCVRGTLRLTCFTDNKEETKKIIKDLIDKNNKINLYSDFEESSISDERFRNFLNTYTKIGLDLLKNFGELCSRRLVAEYRFDYHPHTRYQRATPKEFFESVFSRHSQFFRELNENYPPDQLWEDFKKVDEQGVWIHFLVNMFLTLDLSPYGVVVSEQNKNNFLETISLDLPENWRKNCDF